MNKLSRIIVVVLWACLTSYLAYGHKFAPSLLQIEEQAKGSFNIFWRTPLNSVSSPQPAFPRSCELSSATITPVGTALEWRWKMKCDSGLAGEEISVTGLAASQTAALLRYQSLAGEPFQRLLTSDAPSVKIPDNQSGAGVLSQYFSLGIKHILIGIDHLFFVSGLLLLAANWRILLKTVTAFTLGHSITLVLVSLKIIPQWPSLVEFSIAITILLLAIELSRKNEKNKTSLLRKYQWPVAALFGLVHGLGFAGVLSELGLPETDLVTALIAFNIGIEVGQLMFVAALAGWFFLAARFASAWYSRMRFSLVYGMGGIAVYWCLDRGVALLIELV